jgi:hypothetical protein
MPDWRLLRLLRSFDRLDAAGQMRVKRSPENACFGMQRKVLPGQCREDTETVSHADLISGQDEVRMANLMDRLCVSAGRVPRTLKEESM